MISIKKDVSVIGLKPEILIALMVANDVYKNFETECIVTSGVDGVHSTGSLHYSGCAIDIRTRNLEDHQRTEVQQEIAKRLGDQYDVVLESTHLHIEFDPD